MKENAYMIYFYVDQSNFSMSMVKLKDNVAPHMSPTLWLFPHPRSRSCARSAPHSRQAGSNDKALAT